MRYFFLVFSLLSLSLIHIFSQESTVKVNHEGKDITMLKHAWSAQWITHPTAPTLEYGVFCFRRSFNLDIVPEEFIVHVSADNRYRLYVNGKYVNYGPAIGDINHYRYESLDISGFLNTGKNVITAEVVNFGEFRRAAQQTFQTGFILQSDSGNPNLNINTGTSDWKVIRNEAYSYIPFTTDSLKAYYAAGPGERINSKLYPWGWQETEFDDSNWLSPKKCMVEFAVGRGFLYGSTWFLVPREIPLMFESTERLHSIRKVKNLKNVNEFFKEGVSTKIPPKSRVSILLDNKKHTSGFPEIHFSKGKGSEIKITYAESLFGKIEAVSTGGAYGTEETPDPKGNRDEIDGKDIFGYYDIIYPDGGINRNFRNLSRKTFRYIQFDIVTGKEELILDDYYNVYTVYPFEEKAEFSSNNSELSKIWDAAWLTIRNSSEDSFFDPYYEQLQYIGDTRIKALVSVYVSGDDRLMKQALRQFDNSRLPEGLTQSRFPSYIVQIIPTYSLLWIAMVHDFFIYRNDPDFVRGMLPGIRGVLNWFAERIDETGMVTNLSWWNFTDWASGFPNGIPPGADDGYSANVNLQLVYALQKAVELFEAFGLKDEAQKYASMENTVRNSVLTKCYSAERKMIAETPALEIYSQHSNIWAILTNTIPPGGEQQALIKTILEENDLIQATLYFKFYLFRALQHSGMADLYLDMLDPWYNMLSKGMTTFGETDINPRSDCHGWSSSPCFDFIHTVAGIYPGSPCFQTVIVEPNFGKLKVIEVIFPHPEGILKLKLNKTNNKVEGVITMPGKTTGEFRWNGNTYSLIGGENKIYAN